MQRRLKKDRLRLLGTVVVLSVMLQGAAQAQTILYGAPAERIRHEGRADPVGPQARGPSSGNSILLSTAPLSSAADKRCSFEECRTTYIDGRSVKPTLAYPLESVVSVPSPELPVFICPVGVTSGPNCRMFVEKYEHRNAGLFERHGTLPDLKLPGCFRLIWPPAVQSRSFAIVRFQGEAPGVPCFD
jgi:hypothetical protein